MIAKTVRTELPVFEIEIDAVDELNLQEVYIEDKKKADRFKHQDAGAVNIWRS